VTVTDKEIIKKKIKNLHVLTQEELPVSTPNQVTDAIHDIVDVIGYLYER